jgi:signal peptidase II
MDDHAVRAGRSLRAWMFFALTAVVGLTLDLWTKDYAFRVLSMPADVHEIDRTPERHFIPHLLHFTLMKNEGAVFGIGQGKRSLFLAVSVAALALLVGLFLKSGNRRFYQFLLGLLLAGVLGNLYDRAVFGYVRDMIYLFPGVPNPLSGIFPQWGTLFPWVFNLADTFLCTGVFLMILYSLFANDAAPKPTGATSSADQAEGAPRR